MSKVNITFQALVFTVVLFLSGCGLTDTYYIDGEKSNIELNVSEETIKEFRIRIQQENMINGSLFSQFSTRGINLSVQPYPKLKSLHQQLLKIEKRYKRESRKTTTIANQYRKLITGRSNVSDDSTEWSKIEGLHRQYRAGVDRIKVHGADYQLKYQHFVTLTNNHEIYVIQKIDLKNKMQAYIQILDKRSLTITGLVTETNNNIKNRKNQSPNQSQLQKLEELENEVRKISLYFEHVKKHSLESLAKIDSEFRDRDSIWTESSMKIRTSIVNMQHKNTVLNKKIDMIRSKWDAI